MNSLFYTSGTTGTPKGVVRAAPSKEETARRQAVLEACYGLTPESRGLVTTPLCHMFASNFAQTTLRLGGLLVVMPRFDATEFLRIVARHGITNAQVVPTMFVRLLRLSPDERARYDTSTLRHVLHTGAPCPPKVKHDMIDWFGPVIWEQYGSTETGVVALCDTAEWLAHPGTVGRPFLTSEIRIFSKSGATCPPGTPGEIYARMHGTPDFSYLGRPEARAEVEREGLISAGDIGELDADGYLYLRDRRQDLILSGGNNIYPAEVEARLAEHPDVSDCAVFGVPDEEFGQRAVAAVSLRDGAGGAVADTLEAFLRTALAAYKVPRELRRAAPDPQERLGQAAAPRCAGPLPRTARRGVTGQLTADLAAFFAECVYPAEAEFAADGGTGSIDSPVLTRVSGRRGGAGCGTCSAPCTRRAWWSATPRPRTSPRSWGAARSSGRWRCTA